MGWVRSGHKLYWIPNVTLRLSQKIPGLMDRRAFQVPGLPAGDAQPQLKECAYSVS